MHPLIEEICRAREVQPHALGRWQHDLRTVIQPMLDELAQYRDVFETPAHALAFSINGSTVPSESVKQAVRPRKEAR